MLPARPGLAPRPTTESLPGIFPPIFLVYPPVTEGLQLACLGRNAASFCQARRPLRPDRSTTRNENAPFKNEGGQEKTTENTLKVQDRPKAWIKASTSCRIKVARVKFLFSKSSFISKNISTKAVFWISWLSQKMAS